MPTPELPDYGIAVEYLRTMASLQAEGTRARLSFDAAIDVLAGPKLHPDNMAVVYNFPVYWEGNLAGHATFTVTVEPHAVFAGAMWEYADGSTYHPEVTKCCGARLVSQAPGSGDLTAMCENCEKVSPEMVPAS